MNIDDFKFKCMKFKQLQDEIKDRYVKFQKEQEQYASKCYAPVWKFNWFRLKDEAYCPNCGEKLRKDIIQRWRFISDVLFTCTCGYEYAW